MTVARFRTVMGVEPDGQFESDAKDSVSVGGMRCVGTERNDVAGSPQSSQLSLLRRGS